MSLADSLRILKRKVCSGGYAAPVHQFLRKIDTVSFPTGGEQYFVNLSFDLELGLNTYFWKKDFSNAIRLGKIAQSNLQDFFAYLTKEDIRTNVQLVGALLDQAALKSRYVIDDQNEILERHNELFILNDTVAELLIRSKAELGIHGYTHRLFRDMRKGEAQEEIQLAVNAFRWRLGDLVPPPSFMSFPRNAVAHTDILRAYGITHWRTNRQVVQEDGEIPLGLWFSKSSFAPEDLDRFLREIRRKRKGFFLHMWGHLTEMDFSVFKDCIDMFRKNDFIFVTTRDV